MDKLELGGSSNSFREDVMFSDDRTVKGASPRDAVVCASKTCNKKCSSTTSSEENMNGKTKEPTRCKECAIEIKSEHIQSHECPLEPRPGPEGQPSKAMSNEEEASENGDIPKNSTGDGDSLKQCKFYRLGCKFVGNRFELDLHMDIASETHLDIVCKAIQEIKSEYIKKENKIITKHENKIKMLQDYICKQNVIIKDLHQTNRGLEATTRNIQGKLKDTILQTEHIADEIANLKLQNATLHRELSETRDTSFNGTLLWKVNNVTEQTQKAVMTSQLSVYSPTFYTSRYGYKLRAQLFLNGHGLHAGEYVSLYFHILPTDYDDVLKWPFTHRITFSLLEQQGEGFDNPNNVSFTLVPSPEEDNFKKPGEKMSGGQGKSEFVSLERFCKGNYIKNDCVFIKVKVHCKKE